MTTLRNCWNTRLKCSNLIDFWLKGNATTKKNFKTHRTIHVRQKRRFQHKNVYSFFVFFSCKRCSCKMHKIRILYDRIWLSNTHKICSVRVTVLPKRFNCQETHRTKKNRNSVGTRERGKGTKRKKMKKKLHEIVWIFFFSSWNVIAWNRFGIFIIKTFLYSWTQFW